MVYEDEACIKTRWRIEGQGILTKIDSGSQQWFDGIATFRVDDAGKIARVEVGIREKSKLVSPTEKYF